MTKLWKILTKEDAATSVEYAIMLAMVLLITLSAIGLLGEVVGGSAGSSAEKISDAMDNS